MEEITGIKEVKVKSLKKEKQELAKEVLKAKKKVKEREEDVASCDNAAMLSNDEGPIPFNLFTTPDVVLDVNENIYGSPPPFQTLNDVSTLADEYAIEDQETLSISIKQVGNVLFLKLCIGLM